MLVVAAAPPGFTEYPAHHSHPRLGRRRTRSPSVPDGASWFAESDERKDRAHHHGRRGDRDRSPVHHGCCQPYGVAPKPTARLVHRRELPEPALGALHGTGTLTREIAVQFDAPDPFGVAQARTAASGSPSGSATRGAIGHISAPGPVNRYYRDKPVPTVDGQPYLIAPGPDGAMWFTERNGNRWDRPARPGRHRLGRRPLDRADRRQPAHRDRRRPGRRTLVHGVRLNKIGRLTTAGDFTEFPLPRARTPAGRHHDRPRRRTLVHRAERQPDRPHHDSGRDHRGVCADSVRRSDGDRDGAGRRTVVHRAERGEDRAGNGRHVPPPAPPALAPAHGGPGPTPSSAFSVGRASMFSPAAASGSPSRLRGRACCGSGPWRGSAWWRAQHPHGASPPRRRFRRRRSRSPGRSGP